METIIKTLNNQFSPRVIDLVLAIQQKEFNVPVTLEDQPDLLDIEKCYLADGGNFWGAFTGEELVGTIGLMRFSNRSAAIRKMFVKKDFRGKAFGIGQQLLDTLLSYCLGNGIQNLYLGTVPILKAAHRFYERNLFEKTEKEQLPADFPLMPTDNIFFSRKLL